MKAPRKILAGFVALLGLTFLLVIGANAWKSGLVVSKIVIEGTRVVDANEILQLAHVKPGSKMYDLDLMVIQKDVVSHHFLKDAVVERDLPSTLKIAVVERSPIAMVKGGEILYLDPEGVVLPHSISQELFDLPMISNLPPEVKLSIGSVVQHPDVAEALSILTTAKLVNKELYHLISEVRLRNKGDLIFYTTDGGVPVLFGRGSHAAKLLRLEAFWNDVVRGQGTGGLRYIDLRYDDQVVVEWASNTKSSKIL
jgi:cell division protein FtsQ